MTDTSKSYAEALFSLALESDTLEETLAALKMLRDGILDTPGAMDLLASPSIPKDERCAVLASRCGLTPRETEILEPSLKANSNWRTWSLLSITMARLMVFSSHWRRPLRAM